MSDALTWLDDCGGDKVLDQPLVRFYAVTWPDGSWSASVLVGEKEVAKEEQYHRRGTQASGMAEAEAWLAARQQRAIDAVRSALGDSPAPVAQPPSPPLQLSERYGQAETPKDST